MTTLLTICQTALKEIGDYDVSTTIVGNSNPTAVQMLALANRSGQQLCKRYKWQVLLITYTFSTSNNTATYALPSDFQRFSNITQWNRSQYKAMQGPVSADFFETLRSGNLVSAGAVQYFRIAGSLFAIYPTPTATETIAYQYYSNQWISGKSAFTLDADVPLLDADLIIQDLRWRFLSAKGLPHDEERQEFMDSLAALQADDGGKDIIQFGGAGRMVGDNLPDAGFGS